MIPRTQEKSSRFTEEDMKEFLKRSGSRVADLASQGSKMRNMSYFDAAARYLEEKIPESKVHFYGTRVMQLGHPKSHLNIFLEIGDSYSKPLTPDFIEKIRKSLQDLFKSEFAAQNLISINPNETSTPVKLWNSPIKFLSTPALTLRVNYKKLQCDITFDSGLSVENTKLVHFLFSLQPEAFKLYHFVRIWIHIDEFAFKRYMVALLVVFFMQQKNMLPSVVDLQKDVDEKWIAGWNVSFNRKKSISSLKLEYMEIYTDHLAEFFKFYQKFDFANNVICPYLGQAIPIKQFNNEHESFKKFTGNLKGFNFQPVNVADMFNLNFNVAFGVGKKRIKKFVPFCEKAVEILHQNGYC